MKELTRMAQKSGSRGLGFEPLTTQTVGVYSKTPASEWLEGWKGSKDH